MTATMMFLFTRWSPPSATDYYFVSRSFYTPAGVRKASWAACPCAAATRQASFCFLPDHFLPHWQDDDRSLRKFRFMQVQHRMTSGVPEDLSAARALDPKLSLLDRFPEGDFGCLGLVESSLNSVIRHLLS